MKYKIRYAISKLIFNTDSIDMLFVDLLCKDDGYYITASLNNDEIHEKKISDSTDCSNSNIKKIAKQLQGKDINVLIKEIIDDFSIEEAEDLKNQMLSELLNRKRVNS